MAKSKDTEGTPAVPKDAPARTDSDAPPTYKQEKARPAPEPEVEEEA